MNCICNKHNHKITMIRLHKDSYSFNCTCCSEKHKLVLTRPLQIHCIKICNQISHIRKYNHWNRPSLDFCINCLNHHAGGNIGHCWFYDNCKSHQLNFINGFNLTLYNKTTRTTHGSKFVHCFRCGNLWIMYKDPFTCPCKYK